MHSAIHLEGKAAVITGGGGAIGAATGVAMGAAGARVLLVDIDERRLASAADAVGVTGADVRTHVADVTNSTAVRGYVAAALDAFGAIDVFFNNAAIIGPIGTLADYDEEAFDRVMAVNVRGVFLGLRHVLPVMLARRSGSAINTGSLSSERGLPGTPAYNAAKHAVLGLTRSAASEVAHAGVRVNAVLPGMIDTPMLAEVASGLGDPDRRAERGRKSVAAGQARAAGGGRRSGGLSRVGCREPRQRCRLAGGRRHPGNPSDRGAAVTERDGLIGHIDRYLAALAANDPSGLHVADGVRFTENGQTLALGNGLWATATRVPDHDYAQVEDEAHVLRSPGSA